MIRRVLAKVDGANEETLEKKRYKDAGRFNEAPLLQERKEP